MMMMAWRMASPSSSSLSSSSSRRRQQQQQQTWCSQYSQPLEPLMEGPDPNMQDEESGTRYDYYHRHHNKKEKDLSSSSSGWEVIRDWFRMHKEKAALFLLIPGAGDAASSNVYDNNMASAKTQDLRLLLSVLGCPLAPIPLLLHHPNNNNNNHNDYAAQPHCYPLPNLFHKRNIPLETYKARYIIQQYLAATGCLKKRQQRQQHQHSNSNGNGQEENMYATGIVKMICCETEVVVAKANKANSSNNNKNVERLGRRRGQNGRFVLWQMMPGMWSLELVLGSSSSSSDLNNNYHYNNINDISCNKVIAGSDGKIVWRHTPWLGTHAAKGPQRPLRRIIQGLDPRSTASLFGKAECLGERRIGEEDCFVLKVAADRTAVMERSEGPAEVIRHVLYGYFSQKTGLLVYLEDSHLTRVLQFQTTPPPPPPATSTCESECECECECDCDCNCNDQHHHRQYNSRKNYEYDDINNNDNFQSVYWETTIGSSIGDYKDVDGRLIAHEGRSIATVFRFADHHEQDHHSTPSRSQSQSRSQTQSQQYMYSRTRMEEIWRIDDVAFNVPGLSIDCFIPPSDLYF